MPLRTFKTSLDCGLVMGLKTGGREGQGVNFIDIEYVISHIY